MVVRETSRRAKKLMRLSHALVGLVCVLDVVLESFAFWRQKLRDLINARVASRLRQNTNWPILNLRRLTLPSYGEAMQPVHCLSTHLEHGPFPLSVPQHR